MKWTPVHVHACVARNPAPPSYAPLSMHVHTNPHIQVVVGGGPDNRFTFDHVFTPRDRQAAIYQECVGPLVAAHLDGYNATILAYGQVRIITRVCARES